MVSMSEHVHQQDHRSEARGGTPSGRSGTLGRDGLSMLEDAVRRDVIPRLVAMSWVGKSSTAIDNHSTITDGTFRTLIALCLEPNSKGVTVFVTELHRSGVTAATIYEGLLAPAARELGVMWENDTCSLADVTIGVLRLQNAQRALASHPLDRAAPPLGAPRALLMPVPGEQHTFGLSIVLDYFVRAGWEARLGPAGSRLEALALIKRERTELVGLSFACDDRIPDATALITAIRHASRNPNLIIMVGGPPFMEDQDLASRIGADATATDGQQAVLRANELLQVSDTRLSVAPPSVGRM